MRKFLRPIKRHLINHRLKKRDIKIFNGLCDYASNKPLAGKQALDHIFEGNILVARNFFDHNKLWEDLENCVDTKKEDFAKTHEKFSGQDLVKKVKKARDSIDTLTLQTEIISIIAKSLGLNKVYCELEPNIRIQPPYSHVKKSAKEIESKVGTGQITPHSVHKDSWYFHPKNTLNIWVAGTKASNRSGLSILPQSQNYYPEMKDQALVNYEDALSEKHFDLDLEPGDLVVFLAELMHGSIINQTNDTRYTLSMRLSTTMPNSHIDKLYWYDDLRINKDKANLKRVTIGEGSFNPASIHSDKYNGANIQDSKYKLIQENSHIRVEDVTNGQCMGKFSKKCPHQGVNLMGGHYCAERNGLVCPAHRMLVKDVRDSKIS